MQRTGHSISFSTAGNLRKMGICASVDSSVVEKNEFGCPDNIVYIDQSVHDAGKCNKVGSLFTQEGTKGLNQDAALLYQGYGVEDGVFCGVFDGHGRNGHIMSKAVRNRLPSLLLNQKNVLDESSGTYNIDDDDSVMTDRNIVAWKKASVSAFKAMDKEIKLLEDVDCTVSGTTAVVVIKQGGNLVIANLGDSRAVLGTLTGNGIKASQLTTDLKPGLPVELERITTSKGRVFALKQEPHVQRVWVPEDDYPGLAMSRAFGDFDLKSYGVIAIPDVSCHHLSPQDQFILLASDGVWDVLTNDEVVSIIWSAKSREEKAADAVVEAAKLAWKTRYPASKVDDSTAVCLFLQKTG